MGWAIPKRIFYNVEPLIFKYISCGTDFRRIFVRRSNPLPHGVIIK